MTLNGLGQVIVYVDVILWRENVNSSQASEESDMKVNIDKVK
jgi:hypothetical protein